MVRGWPGHPAGSRFARRPGYAARPVRLTTLVGSAPPLRGKEMNARLAEISAAAAIVQRYAVGVALVSIDRVTSLIALALGPLVGGIAMQEYGLRETIALLFFLALTRAAAT